MNFKAQNKIRSWINSTGYIAINKFVFFFFLITILGFLKVVKTWGFLLFYAIFPILLKNHLMLFVAGEIL